MFSDSRTSAPGEQRGFKPHAPHFIPWLRNSLKPQHSGDLGFSGPYKPSAEARTSAAPLERAKGIGLFSIQARGRAKKGDLRCNGVGVGVGVGVGRMLPVVLRGHHMLPGSLGKRREDGAARWSQPAELDPDPSLQTGQAEGPVSGSASTPDQRGSARTSRLSLPQSQQDGTGTHARAYGPLAGPCLAPLPALFCEEPKCELPVVVCVEDGRGKVWDCSGRATYGPRGLHSSAWLSSDSRGLIERQRGLGSSFDYMKQQSQRALTAPREPPVEGVNGALVSTEDPHRDYTTLRGPRAARPGSERVAVLGQNQTWLQHRPRSDGESQRRKDGGCSMKVVRNQIKCVVDNLEQVLTALRDVQQEMKEVVGQIDYLTSSIDLNEEEWATMDDGDSSSCSGSSSGSSSSRVTVGSAPHVPPEPPRSPATTRRDHPLSSHPSERSRALQVTCRSGSASRQGGPHHNNLPLFNPIQLQSLAPHDCTLSGQRLPPGRPPTPGLSPLTVNLHPPSSPGSQPRSPVASPSIRVSPASSPPRLSTKPHPPPVLSPSVIIETKAGFYQTPQRDHPSAGPLSPSSAPSAGRPPAGADAPTAPDTDAHGAPQRAPAAPPASQGRRGRKPPPYPHHRLLEPAKKAQEPREAPPYPEKRRLLSTTV
ncbi:uncharacterized protein LOC114853869 [Betta splendens]|uniref:Uncharacterized protein LOC114853869 n=1 Tax=Betta splendens TaxID=158456 RepID=A0A6P7MBD7_BETSP|nr:uncharacterized protein LOC114853869 [Betta splendens]XP_029003536.1 uncharacterized protein LOC114853869 [Betta splendens]XP_029003537.1 uncharacterized protein LOC114853869 [Betta splendens]XP_029003538.1 uncharacterized protein LOC114853869 [Betta splendens]XP_029003539.1 uncharacterized protein LOC114853869 [Betta splendens]